MAQVEKKKATEEGRKPVQLELVYTNSHNPFWQSSLFNEVYLQNDVPVKYKELWETDEAGPFYEFCNGFRNLCEELKGADFNSWSERNTINRLIKPILRMLGYTDKCSPNQEPWAEDEPFTVKEGGELKTYKPDLIIVNDPRELKYIERKKSAEKVEEARNSVILPIEVKYWARIEDVQRPGVGEDVKRSDKKDQTDSTRSLDFDEQCLKYMEILNKDFGILTDGKTWRLFNLEHSSDSYRRNYQFNLGHLIRHVNAGLDEDTRDYVVFLDAAKYFYHFFSKAALFSEGGGHRFVDELLEYSKKYVTQVKEDLKERFVKGMTIACNGFQRAAHENKANIELADIRNVAESHLFNILFIKHCESRNILPLKQSPEFRKEVSLSNTIDKLEHFNPEREEDGLNIPVLKRMFSKDFTYDSKGTELYDRLLRLTKLVQDGSSRKYDSLEIRGFRESIFTKEEWSIAQSLKLSNAEMVRILFELGYCKSDVPGKKFQQIPYNFFAPRQLGSIYESFLEFRIERAKEDMAYLRRQWVAANLTSEKVRNLDVPKVRKGTLFFTPDNAERKVTGSYYTPDCVVQFILNETVGPICAEKSSSQLLEVKVCDPAMGSGHFLSGALNYLARLYLRKLDAETNDDVAVTLVEAKQRVLHHCIFGVDINPRAVKLAKMSLWMESATPNSRLESLDDQLHCADSLLDESLWQKNWKFLQVGVDVVIGNPPYLGEKGHKEVFQPISEGWLGRRFYQGKMDLLYFFYHLGLDILRDGGKLGFITTNYFPTATGGTKLRTDMKSRAGVNLLMNLNEVKVFGEAAGQHNMITIVTKGSFDGECVTVTTAEKETVSAELLSAIRAGINSTVQKIKQGDLFEGEENYIRMGTTTKGAELSEIQAALSKLKIGSTPLGELFNVNQGIVSGADKVSERHITKFGVKARKGDGIFVLNRSEVKTVLFDSEGKKLLRPWFKNSDIRSFATENNSPLVVIYNDRDATTIPSSVRVHLSKFRTALDKRREVEKGIINWFQLQWPREKSIFEGPKIVAPQRNKINVFGYNEVPWFASADVYFITEKARSCSLKYILGLLNSTLYFSWLYVMGKRKGEMLELYQTPLCEVPVPKFNTAAVKEIAKLSDKLVSDPNDKRAMDRLNELIFDEVGLTANEKKAVISLYEARKAAVENAELEVDEELEAA